MNLFLSKLKTSFYVVALLPFVSLTSAFAQMASTESPIMSTSSVTDVHHLHVNPTLISLHSKDTSLRTIMEELAKQAGIKLNPPPKRLDLENKNISIDIKHQPFWMAVRAVCKASKINLSIHHWGNQTTWDYTRDANLNSPYLVSQGPFLIVADNVQVHSSISTKLLFGGKSVRTGYSTAQIFVSSYVDPALSLSGISENIETEQIVDEKGTSLIRKRNYSFVPAYGTIGSFPPSFASLEIPRDLGKRIVVFKGNLRFLQLKKSFTWDVPDILNAKGATKTIICNGLPVLAVINDLTKTDNGYTVRMTLSWKESSLASQNLGNQLQFMLGDVAQCMHLLDSKGTAFHRDGAGTGSDGKNNHITVFFTKGYTDVPAKDFPGTPTKLVIKIPTELTEIKVPFEFTNLSLPAPAIKG
jgi:hypothetical protein